VQFSAQQTPEVAKEVAAFAAASNLITTTIGTYFTLFLSLPFTVWAYGVLEPILGRDSSKSVAENVREDLSDVTEDAEATEKLPVIQIISIWLGVGGIALAANSIAFKTIPDSSTVAGCPRSFFCAWRIGYAVYKLTRSLVPAVLWISLIAMALTYPTLPYAAETAALTGRINFLALATPVIALAGLSIAKDLPVFRKLGWRIVVACSPRTQVPSSEVPSSRNSSWAATPKSGHGQTTLIGCQPPAAGPVNASQCCPAGKP